MQNRHFKPDQLEAIEILSKLFSIQDSLKRSDRAYIQGWKNYILKNWADFRVGKYRIKTLQAVANSYSIDMPVTSIQSDDDDDSMEERKEASFFEKLPLKQRRELLRTQLGLTD